MKFVYCIVFGVCVCAMFIAPAQTIGGDPRRPTAEADQLIVTGDRLMLEAQEANRQGASLATVQVKDKKHQSTDVGVESHRFQMEAMQKYGEAESSFRRAVELFPANAAWRAKLAEALFALGRNQEASSELRQAVQSDPKEPEWHNRLGEAYVRQGSMSRAEAEFREAVQIESGNAVYHRNLGIVLQRQNKPGADQEIAEAERLSGPEIGKKKKRK